MSKYTFIMPAYKTGFIRESVLSILNQTYDDWTLIVSDDCSPYNLKGEISDLITDERIVFRSNPENIGAQNLTDHWNLLLKMCESEYVIVASDDDIYEPDFLIEIDKLATTFPEYDVLMGRCQIIDNNGNIRHTAPKLKTELSQNDYLEYLLIPESIICIGNYTFKVNPLRNRGGFVNLPLGWKSDSATAIIASEKGIASTSLPVFSFRRSGNSISSSEPDYERNRQKTLSVIEFFQLTSNFFKNAGIIRTLQLRLCGEIRSYYDLFSFNDFIRVYRQMYSAGMFTGIKSRLAYLFRWPFLRIKKL